MTRRMQQVALVQGCLDVLSAPGVMFGSRGMGEAVGYTLTLSAHRVKTLHGHSEEGSHIRKVSGGAVVESCIVQFQSTLEVTWRCHHWAGA